RHHDRGHPLDAETPVRLLLFLERPRPGGDHQGLVPMVVQVLEHPEDRIGHTVDIREEALRDNRNSHALHHHISTSPRGVDGVTVAGASNERRVALTLSHHSGAAMISPTTKMLNAGITASVHPRPSTRTRSGSARSYSTRTRGPASRPTGYSSPDGGERNSPVSSTKSTAVRSASTCRTDATARPVSDSIARSSDHAPNTRPEHTTNRQMSRNRISCRSLRGHPRYTPGTRRPPAPESMPEPMPE